MGRTTVSKPQAPKFANMTSSIGPAEMESICEGLERSLLTVVSNHGAAGPNHQTVQEVNANCGTIQPNVLLLRSGF